MLDDAMLGVIVGVALGVSASAPLARFIQPFLFGVDVHDAASYVATVLLLGAVTLVASYVPSRRASRTDQAVALRAE